MSVSIEIIETTQTRKRGRPRKYHTEEEYAEAKKRYYETKKAKIEAKAEQRKVLESQKSELQKEVTQMLQDNVFSEEKMEVVASILLLNTPAEAQQQNDTGS